RCCAFWARGGKARACGEVPTMNPINATQAYAGHTAEAAYSRWAPIYDLVFDLPFHPGRAAAARAAAEAARPGGEILVVGVGTGLELPLLPGNVLVTGI